MIINCLAQVHNVITIANKITKQNVALNDYNSPKLLFSLFAGSVVSPLCMLAMM